MSCCVIQMRQPRDARPSPTPSARRRSRGRWKTSATTFRRISPLQLRTFPPSIPYDTRARRRISERFIFQHERAFRAGAAMLPLISKRRPADFQFRGSTPAADVERDCPLCAGQDGRPQDDDQVHQFLKAEVRPWYSVAHLAAAFQLMAREFHGCGSVMSFCYQDAAFFAEVLRRADEVADHSSNAECKKDSGRPISLGVQSLARIITSRTANLAINGAPGAAGRPCHSIHQPDWRSGISARRRSARTRNPRAHGKRHIQQIAKSIETFGFNVPIGVDLKIA